MGTSNELNIGARQELVRRMCSQCADSEGIVRKVVRFANNDVPEYLQNLRRFEQESRKVQVLVK